MCTASKPLGRSSYSRARVAALPSQLATGAAVRPACPRCSSSLPLGVLGPTGQKLTAPVGFWWPGASAETKRGQPQRKRAWALPPSAQPTLSLSEIREPVSAK